MQTRIGTLQLPKQDVPSGVYTKYTRDANTHPAETFDAAALPTIILTIKILRIRIKSRRIRTKTKKKTKKSDHKMRAEEWGRTSSRFHLRARPNP